MPELVFAQRPAVGRETDVRAGHTLEATDGGVVSPVVGSRAHGSGGDQKDNSHDRCGNSRQSFHMYLLRSAKLDDGVASPLVVYEPVEVFFRGCLDARAVGARGAAAAGVGGS